MEQMVNLKYIFSSLPTLVTFLFAMSGIHFLLYNKSPKYYLFIMKLFSRWKDNNWNMSAIYKLEANINFFKEFENVLKDIYGANSYRKRVNLQNKKLYEFSVFSLIVQSNLDVVESTPIKVELHFNGINVTYKNSNERLEELQRIFHKLEERLNFNDKTYDLKIKFGSNFHNPFYGVAIRHLGEEHVRDFECSFSVGVFDIRHNQNTNNDENREVHVFKDCIDINNNDFDIVKSCARKCLLLE